MAWISTYFSRVSGWKRSSNYLLQINTLSKVPCVSHCSCSFCLGEYRLACFIECGGDVKKQLLPEGSGCGLETWCSYKMLPGPQHHSSRTEHCSCMGITNSVQIPSALLISNRLNNHSANIRYKKMSPQGVVFPTKCCSTRNPAQPCCTEANTLGFTHWESNEEAG